MEIVFAAMGYVEKILHPTERVRWRAQLHWIIFLRAGLLAIFGLACIVWGIYQAEADFAMQARALGTIALAVALMVLVGSLIAMLTTEIVVTDQRVIVKRGLIARRTNEMNAAKVESVDVDQSVLGRLLDYGDVVVRGAGAGLNPIRNVDMPLELRRAIVS